MSEPYTIDWVDLGLVPGLAGVLEAGGRLGMGYAPGKVDRYLGLERDVAADVATLRGVHGVTAVVLLVEDPELVEMGITGLPAALADAGIDLIRFPIRDFDVPADLVAFGRLVDDVLARVRGGGRVLVACFGGFGRTGTVTACVLRSAGMPAPEAIWLVRTTRPGTIERDTQAAFVEAWPPGAPSSRMGVD